MKAPSLIKKGSETYDPPNEKDAPKASYAYLEVICKSG